MPGNNLEGSSTLDRDPDPTPGARNPTSLRSALRAAGAVAGAPRRVVLVPPRGSQGRDWNSPRPRPGRGLARGPSPFSGVSGDQPVTPPQVALSSPSAFSAFGPVVCCN